MRPLPPANATSRDGPCAASRCLGSFRCFQALSARIRRASNLLSPFNKHTVGNTVISRAGSVASAVTLSATVLEALRILLSSVEHPDGSLATSLSGDFRLIARIVSTSALVVPAAMLAAGGWATLAGGASSRGVTTGPPAIWLAAAAVGAQSGMAAASGVELLFLSQQRAYTTLALICGGAAVVLGLLRHQAQMLKVALRREDRDKRQADLEAGSFEPAVVRDLNMIGISGAREGHGHGRALQRHRLVAQSAVGGRVLTTDMAGAVRRMTLYTLLLVS